MELGNMMFGNSRGEVQIERDERFEGPWNEFCETLKINWYGYPDAGCLAPDVDGLIDTPIFQVRSYDWGAECDCGADEKMEAWLEANPHGPDCYDSMMERTMAEYDKRSGFKEIDRAAFGGDHSVFSGMNMEGEDIAIDGQIVGHSMVLTPRTDTAMDQWRTAHDLRTEYQDAQRKKLCEERGLSYPEGCAVHCDCGRDQRANVFWTEIGGHKAECRLVQPNFLYKPTGFRINWYKYPFRDSYMTPGIEPGEWARIMKHCIASVLAAQ